MPIFLSFFASCISSPRGGGKARRNKGSSNTYLRQLVVGLLRIKLLTTWWPLGLGLIWVCGVWGLFLAGGLVGCLWFGCVRPAAWDLVGRCLVWLGCAQSFWVLFGRWLVFLGAGWACCHRFHFFGRFYGICDTIGREPVTDSIFFAVLMESATNPRSTIVHNLGCCHKFHFFRRFYGICDTQYENITSSIG
ncbi:hypothetical protein CFREI_11390 [Corynebacterium freiburgense]|nr:hypothetical protein CFREI_11390 [Corynebacterium freiburgense]